MKKLTITSVGADVAIGDPNPLEGNCALSVAEGLTHTFDVTDGQLDRLMPQLQELATRATPTGKPVLSFSVSDDTAAVEGAPVANLPAITAVKDDALLIAGMASLAIAGVGLLADQTKATAVVGGVTYTAVKPGSPGNLITVAHTDPGAASSALAISVAGNAIIVSLETDAGSLIISTAADIVAAINAHATAKFLVLAAGVGATAESAVAATYLAGGAGAGLTVTAAGLACSVLSVTDTLLTIVVPALTGISAAWTANLRVITGETVMDVAMLTA